MNVELISMTPDPLKVIETCGRVCHKSESKDPEAFIKKLIKMGHHSVLEHASATFMISGVSRALTHQLVRHRLMSISQESQRYVNQEDQSYTVPPAVEDTNDYKADMNTAFNLYSKWRKILPKQEDARMFLPNACHSKIAITANFREYRHILDLRMSPHAQWEIRDCVTWIGQILMECAPCVFEDIWDKYQ